MIGIDLERTSGEHQKEDGGTQVNVDAEDCGGEVCNRDGVTVSNAEHDKAKAGENVSGGTSVAQHKVSTTDDMDMNCHTSIEPHDSMEFESKEAAFLFYKEYAKSVGFATIIKASRRSRISGKFIDAKFVCTRYGSKQESAASKIPEPVPHVDSMPGIPIKKKRGRINRSWSKTDCKACMHVKRTQDGRWVVHTFIKEHNHEIFPDQDYYFRGHRNIDLGNNNVDALHAIRARTKKMYTTMSRQSGGIKKVSTQKSGISNSSQPHLPLEDGDAQAMLEHFLYMQDENPNFFYALDLNEEQLLRNVFWVDAKGRLDYRNFDDVVFFDTTYIKNEYKLPFATFTGVNHHCQFILLGCALLADESRSTYSWVMQSWLRAMGKHSPKVILTDQDKSLKESVAEIFPDARHCFCLWHILNKIPEKLGSVLRQHESFMPKFNKCIFKSFTDGEFKKRWWKMVNRFNLRNDIWFQSLYEDREQWTPTYMREIFLAGMSTTQRSESASTLLDKYMQRRTTLKEFLDQYKTILQDKFEEEAKVDFETWHKEPTLKSPSPFGKQMATIYTHAVFKKFQVEVLGVVACHPKKETEDSGTTTFKVQDFEDNHGFVVVWNEKTSYISCSCHLFEYNGFLCRHVMIVLQMYGVHNIPPQYILKRWTKDAKSRQIRTQGSEGVESRAQRYNDICQLVFKLGDEGSLSQGSYNIAFNALEEALKKCGKANNSIQNVQEPGSPLIHALHDFEEGIGGNVTSKTNKSSITKKRQEQTEPELTTLGVQDSWQQMEHLTARVPTHDGYFGTQQIIQGMLSAAAPSRDDYFSSQQSMQGLGQLHSIAPIYDGPYLNQQRLLGLGQLHFRPQSVQTCFNIQDNIQDMGQSNVGPMQLHVMGTKAVHPKQR
ncbi:protein FAR-RED IMPAIRED RESPONSE 1 isoform X2 [Diospyros lotus]|uniref:protein FAR-RED IMPAIRED RESPONSE 1 isoform X2 n=1 Tax=Diospyros lotus TaxID=55363 RepID=UPI0022512C85|nr:protein FAR-RED IMPAIRED RESPONSE 1 isoform X2 [Diospyros lotus]